MTCRRASWVPDDHSRPPHPPAEPDRSPWRQAPPMKSIRATFAGKKWPERLRELARRVDANVPSRHDPEAFHVEKSEIAHALRNIARSLE